MVQTMTFCRSVPVYSLRKESRCLLDGQRPGGNAGVCREASQPWHDDSVVVRMHGELEDSVNNVSLNGKAETSWCTLLEDVVRSLGKLSLCSKVSKIENGGRQYLPRAYSELEGQYK